VLCKVAHRDYKEGAGPVDDPRIVGLDVRGLRRQANASVLELANPRLRRCHHGVQRQRSIVSPVCTGRRVPVIEDINAVVVGEKCLARVKAGR
jgi:hypothetical protein